MDSMDGDGGHCSVEERLSKMRTESCALYGSLISVLVFYKAAAD